MNSDELTKSIAKITGDTCILMFSLGKESICCYYQLKKHFKNVVLVYQYLHPDLSFINTSIDYFERKFEQKIHKMPHVGLFKQINGYLFQPPKMAETVYKMGLPAHNYLEYYNCLREDLELPKAFIALGVRVNDSPIRRMSIKTHGAINKKNKSFYPIYDWNNEQLKECLRDNEVQLPVDYELWGKSFDGVDYRFIKPLRDRFPEDYEKLKDIFPLLDIETLRYEI